MLPPAEAVEHFLVPTFDLRAPGFDLRRYWRRPVQINADWLFGWGCASTARPTWPPSSAPACSGWS